MRQLWGRWLAFSIWGAALVTLINTGTGLWTLKRLEKKAGAPIRGTFFPHLFRPAFTLKNPNLAWQKRFQLLSGTVRVHYDPLSLLPGRKLRVQIGGQDLVVHLGDEWAKSQGLSRVKIKRVRADFAFSDQEDPEIFLLDVDSPQLQFHFGEKGDNPHQGL